jgi:hypothetical protein
MMIAFSAATSLALILSLASLILCMGPPLTAVPIVLIIPGSCADIRICIRYYRVCRRSAFRKTT